MLYVINLDLKDPNVLETNISFTQGDFGNAELSILITENGSFIRGDTGAEIVFELSNGYIVNGNLIGSLGMYKYKFLGNELQSAGKTIGTVTLNYPNGRVSTGKFSFNVRYNPIYDRNIGAGNYISELEKIKEKAIKYTEYLQFIIDQLLPAVGSTALTKKDLLNKFDQAEPGLKALDAAAGKALHERDNELDSPTFEDYTGSTPVPPAATAIANIQSKSKLSTIFSNIKAAFKGVILLSQLVDNCVTDRSDLPGSAKQLKVLMDAVTKLNSDWHSYKSNAMLVSPIYQGAINKGVCVTSRSQPISLYYYAGIVELFVDDTKIGAIQFKP